VTLSTNADGFCELKAWSRTRPESGDYLKSYFWGPKQNWGGTNALHRYQGLAFDLPFDRFYMDENKAPRAEQLARRRTPEFQRDTENTNTFTNCWATVRVLKGTALIEDVLIDGTSIRELSGQVNK